MDSLPAKALLVADDPLRAHAAVICLVTNLN